MGLAQRKDVDDMLIVDEEARRRIDSARVHHLAYRIKTFAPALSDEDAEQLAVVVLESTAEGNPKPSGEYVRQRLIAKGRSKLAAERITKTAGL